MNGDISETEVWRRAQAFVERYGERAEYEAASRADAMATYGGASAAGLWLRVMAAVAEWQRPRYAGERLQ